MQHRVGFQVVAAHTGLFVDSHHLPVLALRQFEIELDAGMVFVLQGSPCQRPGIGPAVKIRTTKQHVAQRQVVIIYAPVIGRPWLVAHENLSLLVSECSMA